MDFEMLEKSEWCFDKVPDAEIIACCYWEYARESSTIAHVADHRWCNTRKIWNRAAYEHDPELKAKDDKIAEEIEERLKRVKFDYEKFSDNYWSCEQALIGIYDVVTDYVSEGARPWTELKKSMRKWIFSKMSERGVLTPAKPSFVGELEKLWNANRSDLDEVRSRNLPPNDDSEDAALMAETMPVIPEKQPADLWDDKVIVALTLDYAHFTNREILAEFANWIKAHRPRRWRRPLRIIPGLGKRGGKLIEYRVALERLGLMRLLHLYSPGELKNEVPEAWSRYKHKKSEFRKEVREAVRFYQKAFPFLSKTDRPRSETRKGIWWPEMQKICEKVEREMGLA